ERETRLEVRLIEAGKREMRPRGHKQRVHKVRIPIERRVARAEADLDDIVFRREFCRWNEDVVFDEAKMRRTTANGNGCQVFRAGTEIENERARDVLRGKLN